MTDFCDRGAIEPEQPTHAELAAQVDAFRTSARAWVIYGLGALGSVVLISIPLAWGVASEVERHGDKIADIRSEMDSRRNVVDRFIALEPDVVRRSELGKELKEMNEAMVRLTREMHAVSERLARVEPR